MPASELEQAPDNSLKSSTVRNLSKEPDDALDILLTQVDPSIH